MNIESFKIYEGRNIYSHKKCIRVDIDLEGYGETPSNKIEGFNNTLLNLLPELKKHKCSLNIENGFMMRLKEGTYLPHICEHIIIAIQNMIGINVAYGKARVIKGEKYYLVYQYEYKETGIETAKIAVDLINSIILKSKFSLKDSIERLKGILKKEELGPSTMSILKEVKRKKLPIIRINDGSMFQIGYGKYSKVIQATITSNTPVVAVDISCDKLMTKELLYNQCIPIAEGGIVNNTVDLLLKSKNIGFPVVLKPRYGNQGKGVVVNIRDEKTLVNVYNDLIKKFKDIIIEKYVEGRDYRVLVVDKKVVAVSERIAPFVIGDGVTTIKELIRNINLNPLRGEGHEKPLTKIKIDEGLMKCISEKGYILSSILKEGEKLLLRENSNLSTGGTSIDKTESICLENEEICIRVAETIGLDVCGIDICCNDISKPISEEGVVIEVNAAPGIRMHQYPSEGLSRNVAASIVDMIFKQENNQIPLISVTGTNGKTTTTRLISKMMKREGYKVGMTTTGGIYIDEKSIKEGDTTGYQSAMTVLRNKSIDAAVLETARGGIIKKGLAYDLADVAVITNITEDHLGLDGVETIEDLAYVKALVAEAVKEEGYVVLNAEDTYSMKILDRVKSNIVMFAMDKENKYLKENLQKGNYGIYIDNDSLIVEKDGNKDMLINKKDIKISFGGILKYNIQNAMAAVGAAIAVGVSKASINSTLLSFSCNEEDNPGRFNLYNLGSTSIILDYGHNEGGYRAILENIKEFKYKRLVGIIGVPGDRLNNSIRDVGRLSSEYFDYVYIKEDLEKRGRKEGEVANLILEGLIKGGLDKNNIEIELSEENALEKALVNSREGDLIIIFFEKREPLVKLINSFPKNIYNSNKSEII